MVDLSGTNGCDPDCTVDFFVENMGRTNFGRSIWFFFCQIRETDWIFLFAGKYHHFQQARKGLWEGDVLLNGSPLRGWTIFAMEFKGEWVQR